jgi:hypothetical protein
MLPLLDSRRGPSPRLLFGLILVNHSLTI